MNIQLQQIHSHESWSFINELADSIEIPDEADYDDLDREPSLEGIEVVTLQ